MAVVTDVRVLGGEHGVEETVLRCDGLTRRFGDRVAVDGIAFRIAAGETYGLLGPNGAGKTTTIKMVCGLPVGTARGSAPAPFR